MPIVSTMRLSPSGCKIDRDSLSFTASTACSTQGEGKPKKKTLHKKNMVNSLLRVKVIAHVLTDCNLVTATQCLPAVAQTGKSTTPPCKHFLAIYQLFPEWGWEAMSPSYNSSPYFQIDCYVIDPSTSSGATASQTGQFETSMASHQDIQQTELNKSQEEDSIAETPAVPSDSVAVSQHSTVKVLKIGRYCRELLKEIQDLTYLCANEVALQSLQ